MSHKSPAPLMLSISGARGIVGESMTPAVARDFAAAFGSSVRAGGAPDNLTVCLGRDTRPSGGMLSAAAAAGLAAVGARVVDLGVVATPTVGVMVAEHRAHGGMVITASHNPVQWNGLKCITSGGHAPSAGSTDEILRRFSEHDFILSLPREFVPRTTDDRGPRLHVDRVLAQVDVGSIRSARLRVVLDSNNGAGGAAGRLLLEALGCEVIALNDEPHGNFTHDPEPLADNMRQLATETAAHNAAVGFGQDPDADRLAIVDDRGRYIGEEYTLVLAARQVLEGGTAGPIAVNLSTSRMIDDVVSQYAGAEVHRTPVGEANVVAEMQRCEAILGGEGNGGVILPSVCWIRDSLGAMALVLDLLASSRQSLGTLVDQLPQYIMIKQKFDVPAGNGESLTSQVTEHFAGARIDSTDGVRADLDDGWVHVRPSNTEPVIRVIAEARTRERALELIEQAKQAVAISQ
ncbi:MAG: phosphoglucosamine mutase [Phycisphaerales bacterium]